MLCPSPVELDAAGDAGNGGMGATHARLQWRGFSRVLLGWQLYGRLSSLLVLVLALAVLVPLLAGWHPQDSSRAAHSDC